VHYGKFQLNIVLQAFVLNKNSLKQAVDGRPPRYAPASVRRTLRPSSSPYMSYASGMRRPARLASSGCRRHEYSRCTGQTSSDVRQHHCTSHKQSQSHFTLPLLGLYRIRIVIAHTSWDEYWADNVRCRHTNRHCISITLRLSASVHSAHSQPTEQF